MSDAEVKNDVAAEAPSAEELKAKKRTAEVRLQNYQYVKIRQFLRTFMMEDFSIFKSANVSLKLTKEFWKKLNYSNIIIILTIFVQINLFRIFVGKVIIDGCCPQYHTPLS